MAELSARGHVPACMRCYLAALASLAVHGVVFVRILPLFAQDAIAPMPAYVQTGDAFDIESAQLTTATTTTAMQSADPTPAGATSSLPPARPLTTHSSPLVDATGKVVLAIDRVPDEDAAQAPARTHAGSPATSTAVAGTNGPAVAANAGSYGAAGDRSAQDLATAFVRAFPQAASGDATWATAKLGHCGSVVLSLELGSDGNLVGHQLSGTPSTEFARGIERALTLIQHRAFTAVGRRTQLALECNIHTDTVHDGLHGDVFALGASYTGSTGGGFFALASGRRIDFTAHPK
jgi:hypothetical protein